MLWSRRSAVSHLIYMFFCVIQFLLSDLGVSGLPGYPGFPGVQGEKGTRGVSLKGSPGPQGVKGQNKSCSVELNVLKINSCIYFIVWFQERRAS